MIIVKFHLNDERDNLSLSNNLFEMILFLHFT